MEAVPLHGIAAAAPVGASRRDRCEQKQELQCDEILPIGRRLAVLQAAGARRQRASLLRQWVPPGKVIAVATYARPQVAHADGRRAARGGPAMKGNNWDLEWKAGQVLVVRTSP